MDNKRYQIFLPTVDGIEPLYEQDEKSVAEYQFKMLILGCAPDVEAVLKEDGIEIARSKGTFSDSKTYFEEIKKLIPGKEEV